MPAGTAHQWGPLSKLVAFCFPCREVCAFLIHRRGSEAERRANGCLVLAPCPVLLPGCDKNLSPGGAPLVSVQPTRQVKATGCVACALCPDPGPSTEAVVAASIAGRTLKSVQLFEEGKREGSAETC